MWILVATAACVRFGAPIVMQGFVPVTAETENGKVSHMRIGMPEENGADASDFFTDLIPGGYKPSDCECYPCASEDGFPVGQDMTYDANGDLSLYRDLLNKVERQERKIAQLRKKKREVKKQLNL